MNNIDLLTPTEVAAVLRVSKMTVYRMIHNGTLASLQVGRSFRIHRQSLEEYVGVAG